MDKIKVTNGQNVVDLGLNAGGSVEAVMELWRENPALVLTGVPVPGIEYIKGKVINQQIVDFYKINNISVGTGTWSEPAPPPAFNPDDLNLTGYWPLPESDFSHTEWNEPDKQANDATGNGNNGLIGSGVALECIAANSDAATFDTITYVGDFTEIGYINIDSSLRGILDSAASSSDTLHVHMPSFRYRNAAGLFDYPLDVAISTGVHHIAIVRTGSVLTVYSDGDLVLTKTGVDTGNFNRDNIGQQQSGQYIDVTIKDVLSFSEAKSAAEVLDIYNNPQDYLEYAQEATCEIAPLLSDYNSTGFIKDYSTNQRAISFSTTAMAPYNPFVVGITVGYQTALGNMQQYPIWDALATNENTGIQCPDILDFEVEFIEDGGRKRFFSEGGNQDGFLIDWTGSADTLTRFDDVGSIDTITNVDVGSLDIQVGDHIRIQASTDGGNGGTMSVIYTNILKGLSDTKAITITGNDFGVTTNGMSIHNLTVGLLIELIVNGTTYNLFSTTNVTERTNIFGTAYNSVTDILGQAWRFLWKPGMLNLITQHFGIDLGVGYATAGVEQTIIFGAYNTDMFESVMLTNKDTGDGFKLMVDDNRIEFTNENGGVELEAVSANDSFPQDEWRFGLVHISAAGLVNFYTRGESETFALSGVADQNVGIPDDGSANLWMGASSGGATQTPGYRIIPPIPILGSITLAVADQTVEYWKTTIINA